MGVKSSASGDVADDIFGQPSRAKSRRLPFRFGELMPFCGKPLRFRFDEGNTREKFIGCHGDTSPFLISE
jgi:hypothetical protein